MYGQLFIKKVGEPLVFLTFLLFQWFHAFFSLHLMEIFPMTNNFWENIVIQRVT